MNANSTTFLDAFVAIEEYLEQLNRHGRGMAFSQLVDILRQQHSSVRLYAEDLKAFARLRNVIVHERGGGKILAEPNDWAVKQICHIRDILLQPPTVAVFSQRKAKSIMASDSVAKATKIMHERHYSQLPVYDEQRYVGLLTTRMITYWLGAQPTDTIACAQVLVGEVLASAEPGDSAIFIANDTLLTEALELFDYHERRQRYVDALLITTDGTPQSPLLGIIAVGDIPRIYEVLNRHTGQA
ncbi:MAG: CBS domain-containing protein [Chloroflexota bacterium]|jgi:predicted transcriptional regulator